MTSLTISAAQNDERWMKFSALKQFKGDKNFPKMILFDWKFLNDFIPISEWWASEWVTLIKSHIQIHFGNILRASMEYEYF